MTSAVARGNLPVQEGGRAATLTRHGIAMGGALIVVPPVSCGWLTPSLRHHLQELLAAQLRLVAFCISCADLVVVLVLWLVCGTFRCLVMASAVALGVIDPCKKKAAEPQL